MSPLLPCSCRKVSWLTQRFFIGLICMAAWEAFKVQWLLEEVINCSTYPAQQKPQRSLDIWRANPAPQIVFTSRIKGLRDLLTTQSGQRSEAWRYTLPSTITPYISRALLRPLPLAVLPPAPHQLVIWSLQPPEPIIGILSMAFLHDHVSSSPQIVQSLIMNSSITLDIRNLTSSKYHPLPTMDHIRILILGPGEDTDPVRCHTKTLSLDEAEGQYEAISYVWGRANEHTEIECDGKRHPIHFGTCFF